MAGRTINPILKQVLELGPTLVFFLIYMRIKDQTYSFGATEYSGFIVAALILVPLLLVATLILWLLTGTISRMQVFVGVMVVFFGGLTAWFNDATFFKMKTTFVYGTFALILGAGLLRGKSLLQWVMAEALPMKAEGWMILTRRLALMFAALAVANEIIWRTQSEETWVILETFAMPVALFLFLMANFMLLQKHMIDEPKDET
ncbi:MAG: septation protein IspZ [Tabrizicola sp.]|jgi:intracellular septation protein|uniref:inner membrane-spanning protein YciB n=1 Tax=Tabrizicola sp. TaxID=2005166 RepID=UPI003BB0CBED